MERKRNNSIYLNTYFKARKREIESVWMEVTMANVIRFSNNDTFSSSISIYFVTFLFKMRCAIYDLQSQVSLSLYVEGELYATCIMCPYKNERSCQWQATPHSESNKNATHFTFLLDLLRFYALNTFLVAKQIKNYNERVIIAFLYIFQRSCEAKKAAKMLQYSIELL